MLGGLACEGERGKSGRVAHCNHQEKSVKEPVDEPIDEPVDEPVESAGARDAVESVGEWIWEVRWGGQFGVCGVIVLFVQMTARRCGIGVVLWEGGVVRRWCFARVAGWNDRLQDVSFVVCIMISSILSALLTISWLEFCGFLLPSVSRFLLNCPFLDLSCPGRERVSSLGNSDRLDRQREFPRSRPDLTVRRWGCLNPSLNVARNRTAGDRCQPDDSKRRSVTTKPLATSHTSPLPLFLLSRKRGEQVGR
jgi:hypothetical protein